VEATNQRPIVVDVFRVNLLFTVSDKKRRFITDLVKDDFQIVECFVGVRHWRPQECGARLQLSIGDTAVRHGDSYFAALYHVDDG
jgi:hypothetical protein